MLNGEFYTYNEKCIYSIYLLTMICSNYVNYLFDTSQTLVSTFATRARIYLHTCLCMINAGTCEAIFYGNR